MTIVLVTGSEGNIGRYLVDALRIKCPTWKILRVKNGAGHPVFDPQSGRYVGDLRRRDLLDLIFTENAVDYVIHAASTSYSHSGYRDHPFKILRDDCQMVLNTLSYARNVKKFVYLSSALAYEQAATPLLTEELSQNLPAPTSSYGVAKYLGEQAVRVASIEHGIRYTIWRPFNVVSPLEPTEGEGRHVFVDFFRRLFVERVSNFRLLGSGNQVRCFLWVEEAAGCIVAAVENPATDNEIINLARDEPISLVQLKELLLSIGREMRVLPGEYDPPICLSGEFSGIESEVRVPSIKKLKRLTGWESTVSVRECFRRFVEAKLRMGGNVG